MSTRAAAAGLGLTLASAVLLSGLGVTTRVRVIPRREFGGAMRRLPTLARVREAAVARLVPVPVPA